MGVTQRMIWGNLSHVFVAPWWRSCCRAVLSSSPDLRGGWPQWLNVSHWRTDSLSLKCVFTRWGMQRTRGEKWKLHKLTLMGCRGERSGFWPFSLSFLLECFALVCILFLKLYIYSCCLLLFWCILQLVYRAIPIVISASPPPCDLYFLQLLWNS